MADVPADPVAPPDRDAVTGGERRRRRGRRGERAVVPDARFTSYYGKPVLNKPTWAARDIAGYLFLGGLAGASSVLAAGAELTGRPALAKGCKAGALVAISGSLYALVHDLGRPARFLNMLRVVKPSSPMSVGSWLLVAYGPQAGLAAVTALTGRFSVLGRVATFGAALVGPAVASYTAALICDTAVPSWHEGHREMPFVFVGSAASAAGGLGLLVAPVDQAGPARRAALVGGAVELVATEVMVRRMGLAAEPLRTGRGGRLVKAAAALTATGAVLGGVLGRRSRAAAVLGGLASLAGSACTRFGVFHAGVASAEDPKYVVRPQRERQASRGAPTAAT
ncbi:NrfD/PsrC family molybdoenzyme membrane anchor subunit [Actinosynnema sp. NPDC059335]|uniref:NrfD/PsrC family molybdoenzyme membrane anchor subunit n=1 Tax=Actinosynnema sp. NPDC059335 TaxID=3346804 RepID=UPI00366B5F92